MESPPLLVVSASCNNIPVSALFNEELAILLNDFVETIQITPASNKEIYDLYAQEEDKNLQTVPNNREVYQLLQGYEGNAAMNECDQHRQKNIMTSCLVMMVPSSFY